jgi:hypothetical protein
MSISVESRVYLFFREIHGKTREIMVDSCEIICKIREIKPSPRFSHFEKPYRNRLTQS